MDLRMRAVQSSPSFCPPLPAAARNARGVTLLEILMVIVFIALMSAFAIPRLNDAMNSQNVRSARAAFVGMNAKARYAAIQRGGSATLTLANNVLSVQSTNPVSNAAQSVGNSVDLYGRYGVTVSPSSLTWTFDARGLRTQTDSTSVTIYKGTKDSTKIVLSPAGRVIQ